MAHKESNIKEQQSVVGTYSTMAGAEAAVLLLSKGHFPFNQVSILTTNLENEKEVVGFVKTGEVVKEGVKEGAWFGGLFGILVGAAFLWVPVVGPFYIAGPLAAIILAQPLIMDLTYNRIHEESLVLREALSILLQRTYPDHRVLIKSPYHVEYNNQLEQGMEKGLGTVNGITLIDGEVYLVTPSGEIARPRLADSAPVVEVLLGLDQLNPGIIPHIGLIPLRRKS